MVNNLIVYIFLDKDLRQGDSTERQRYSNRINKLILIKIYIHIYACVCVSVHYKRIKETKSVPFPWSLDKEGSPQKVYKVLLANDNKYYHLPPFKDSSIPVQGPLWFGSSVFVGLRNFGPTVKVYLRRWSHS